MTDWQVITGDCLEVMRGMDAGSVDAVITDPPYGIGESGKKNMSRGQLAAPRDYGDYQWDDKRVSGDVFSEFTRLSWNQVVFGGNYYTDYLHPSPSWIVWDKNNSGDFADCELAWTSHKKAVRKFKWTWNGFIKEAPEDRYHPTQKPLALMKWVIENYTQPGDLILDPFCGSGTTGVACVQTGRRFIGIEISDDYANIARERIAKAAEQAKQMELAL